MIREVERIIKALAEHNPPKNFKMRKRASVLIPLLESEGEIFLMLTRRSNEMRSHPGQVSFPGGKQDSDDENSMHTALRETHEEIGLSWEKINIIGKLDQILSLHYYLVTPYVGLIPSDFEPVPNTDEIESVFKVPLAFFMKSENHWSEEKKTFSFPVIVHHFEFQGYDIWGLTAKLIFRLLEVGLDFVPDFPVHHPDSPTWMSRTMQYNEE
ncbi:MAG: CoA pyrophosphatase [Deltaproteobacteria bacterium]|nr:CoA pyrophosphatase [Deltaproteobacteria bacterium]